MQISLPELIDQFFDALSTPQGLASTQGTFLSSEQQQAFRVCAELVGVSSQVLEEHESGRTSVDPLTAQFVRNQLISAKRALAKLPVQAAGERPYLIEEFAIDPAAVLQDAEKVPELAQLLRGTYMMAVGKDNREAYKSLTTTLSTRGEALDAIEIIRPDIADALRLRTEKEGLDLSSAGELPATPKQMRDLQASYRALAKTLGHGDDARAQSTLEEIRTESQPKPLIIRGDSQGKIVSRALPGGKEAVVLSTRPRERSTEHFMVELETVQPVLDLCKRVDESKHHADGLNAKYFPTKGRSGEYWLHAQTKEQAEQECRMLRTLLQEKDPHGTTASHRTDAHNEVIEEIRVATDHTNRKHPSFWLVIPRDHFEKAQQEATFIHDLRDEVRQAFDRDDKAGAQNLKDDLVAYAAPRIYAGQHAAAVTESRESANATLGK